MTDHLQDGASFILDAPTTVPAVWGGGQTVAHAEGEAMWIVAPAGTGKTTVAAQYVRGRLGLQDELLGMPVKPDDRPVFYLALDRPRQIARAFRRNFTEADRATLADQLRVWAGPLPFDIGTDPDQLGEFALSRGAGTLVIDSAKDAAMDLSKDETGSRFNRAIQTVLAAEIEVVVLHHQRKASAQNPKPRKLADVYGSTWLTAGAGSVLLLWGEPGDPVVELRTLKPAVGEIGPLMIQHDHQRGVSTIHEAPDLFELVERSPAGITVAEAAISLYGASPSRADRERARRKLEALRRAGQITRPTSPDSADVRYLAVTPRATTRATSMNGNTGDHEPASESGTQGDTADTGRSRSTATPYRGRVCETVPGSAARLDGDDEEGR